MKKLLSVMLILTFVLIQSLSGSPAAGVLSACAVSADQFVFTSVEEESISAVPSPPHILNIIIFGTTSDAGTGKMLEELSLSTLCKVGQYHFIFVDIRNASKEKVLSYSESFSPDISFCYGDYYDMMWDLISDNLESYLISIPVIAYVDDSGSVREVSIGYRDADAVTEDIRSALGDRFIEPEKDKNSVTVEVRGSYYTNIQEALDRINAIRYEACARGIEDPNQSGRRLTLADYHPVVWSSELEKIARQRAAESIIRIGHTRPSDKEWSTANTFTEGRWIAENLAWNNSKDMVVGIEQFYEEKEDWIHHTGRQTGHYTSMIDPSYYSIGLGGFYSDCGYYSSCLAFWLSDAQEGFDQSFGQSTDEVAVPFEIRTSYLSNPRLIIVSKTDTINMRFVADAEINGVPGKVYLSEDVDWTSSDESILTVSNGVVTGRKEGTAVVTASSYCGLSASQKLKITASDIPAQPPTDSPATQPPTDPGMALIRGDADGDNEITILDATTIQRYIASLSVSHYSEAAADADADGDVTILDATTVQRFIASLPTYEGVGKPMTVG